jgi:ferrous iron transport protein B
MRGRNYRSNGGAFPTLIAILTMFFLRGADGAGRSALVALLLTGTIVIGVFLTFAASRLLSATVLRGAPSSFALELPPYRTPQFGRVIVRSLLDRTLFVLGRAVAVAAPAGLLIWLLANVSVGGASLLTHCAGFLDPFARALGLDGVILLAFILGFPANEIVVPIIIMTYTATGSLTEPSSLSALRALLTENGWTWVTAASAMLFCLIHWPCSTTCLTIKKETGGNRWTLLAIALPTGVGLLACFIFSSLARILGFV